jgi:hypothetical protein
VAAAVGDAYALCRLYAVFFSRWPPDAASPTNGTAVALLNALAFLPQMSAPQRLWELLRHMGSAHLSSTGGGGGGGGGGGYGGFPAGTYTDVAARGPSFQRLCAEPDPEGSVQPAGGAAVLVLWCVTYSHLLTTVDEAEMYEQQRPLSLADVEDAVKGLKQLAFNAHWGASGGAGAGGSGPAGAGAGARAPTPAGRLCVRGVTALLKKLHARSSRRAFTVHSTWLLPELDGVGLYEALKGAGEYSSAGSAGAQGAGAGKSAADDAAGRRARLLLQHMPYALSFTARAQLFARLLADERARQQPEGQPAYRISIRREYVLEDAYRGLHRLGPELQKRLGIVFTNAHGQEEVGIDIGGIFKELWTDLSKKVCARVCGGRRASPRALPAARAAPPARARRRGS